MKQADEITLKAFLIALEQLDEPLSESEQTQLQEIAENIDNNLGRLDAIAENNHKLDELYQKVRKSLQNGYTTRNKSSAIAIEKIAKHDHLSYESQMILKMDTTQLVQMSKDLINKINLEANYQLRNPLGKDPECLIGLSRDDLQALAESMLAVSKQSQLDDLLARNSESQLSEEEIAILDGLLGQIDRLTILKTRARYTLKKLDALIIAS